LSHIPLVKATLFFHIPRILPRLHFFDELRHESVEEAICIPRHALACDVISQGTEGLFLDVEDDSLEGGFVAHASYYTKFLGNFKRNLRFILFGFCSLGFC